MKLRLKKGISIKELLKYGFKKSGKVYLREVKHPVYLVCSIERKTLDVMTPLGSAAFIESHQDKYNDLLNDGIVELL